MADVETKPAKETTDKPRGKFLFVGDEDTQLSVKIKKKTTDLIKEYRAFHQDVSGEDVSNDTLVPALITDSIMSDKGFLTWRKEKLEAEANAAKAATAAADVKKKAAEAEAEAKRIADEATAEAKKKAAEGAEAKRIAETAEANKVKIPAANNVNIAATATKPDASPANSLPLEEATPSVPAQAQAVHSQPQSTNSNGGQA